MFSTSSVSIVPCLSFPDILLARDPVDEMCYAALKEVSQGGSFCTAKNLY